MTHHLKHRLLGSVLASAMVPTLALGAVVLDPMVAQADVAKAKCRITTVLLKKAGDGVIPKELEFLRPQLESDEFAIYKGFVMLEQKTLKLKLDKKAEAAFKTGHKLRLTLLGGDDTKLKLHAELTKRDGKESLLGTDYSIEDNGLLMIGAGSYDDGEQSGKLFFVEQCTRES